MMMTGEHGKKTISGKLVVSISAKIDLLNEEQSFCEVVKIMAVFWCIFVVVLITKFSLGDYESWVLLLLRGYASLCHPKTRRERLSLYIGRRNLITTFF